MAGISDFEIDFCGGKSEAHIISALALLKEIEDDLAKNNIKVLNLKEVKEHLAEAYKCMREK